MGSSVSAMLGCHQRLTNNLQYFALKKVVLLDIKSINQIAIIALPQDIHGIKKMVPFNVLSMGNISDFHLKPFNLHFFQSFKF